MDTTPAPPIGLLSGIVLVIAVIYGIRVLIKLLRRIADESRKGWSSYYDDNLHRILDDRPGEASGGRLSVITLFLFLLAFALMHFGL